MEKSTSCFEAYLAFLDKAPEDWKGPCRHEWRIIENFHTEFPRDVNAPRKYAVYCVYCLTSKGIEVNINQ